MTANFQIVCRVIDEHMNQMQTIWKISLNQQWNKHCMEMIINVTMVLRQRMNGKHATQLIQTIGIFDGGNNLFGMFVALLFTPNFKSGHIITVILITSVLIYFN